MSNTDLPIPMVLVTKTSCWGHCGLGSFVGKPPGGRYRYLGNKAGHIWVGSKLLIHHEIRPRQAFPIQILLICNNGSLVLCFNLQRSVARPTFEMTSRVARDEEDFNESTQDEESCDGNETRGEGRWSKADRPAKEDKAEIVSKDFWCQSNY